jgi:L-seryl-tRNA(Ser) seleniumtransferase
MLTLTVADIDARAVRIIEGVGADGVEAVLVAGSSTVGGGSAPGSTLPTRLLAVSHRTLSPADLEARLRAWDPPIVARVEHDRLVLDLRTVFPDQDDVVLQALSALG